MTCREACKAASSFRGAALLQIDGAQIAARSSNPRCIGCDKDPEGQGPTVPRRFGKIS